MIQWINQFTWICIFLCVPFFVKAQFNFGDSLRRVQQYQQAALAYERVVFESGGSATLRQEALLRKAWAYKAQGAYDKAKTTLERIDFFRVENKQLQVELQYELLLASYLSMHLDQALNYAIQFSSILKDKKMHERMLLLHMFVLNDLGEWDRAYKVGQRLEKSLQRDIKLDSMYAFRKNFKLKKPKTARMISTFAPGMGQLYAGYPIKAGTSVVLHGAALSFGVLSVLDGYYLSGFLTGAGLLQAFYFGGIKHSGYLAEKRNTAKIEKYSEQLKTHLVQFVE